MSEDIKLETLLRLIKEKQAAHDLEGMAKAMEKLILLVAEERDAAKVTAILKKVDEALGVPAPQPKPEDQEALEAPATPFATKPAPKMTRQERLIHDLLTAQNEEERLRAAKQLSVQAVARALHRPTVTPNQRQRIQESVQKMVTAVTRGDKPALVIATREFIEDVTSFNNKILDNRNNQMGITKLGPTTAVILQGALHGELTGSLGDRKSQLTPELRHSLHLVVDQEFEQKVRDEPSLTAEEKRPILEALSGSDASSELPEQSDSATYKSPTPFKTEPKPTGFEE